MEILSTLDHIKPTQARQYRPIANSIANLTKADVGIAIKDITAVLTENRPEETRFTPGFAVVTIRADDMLRAIRDYPLWLSQEKAQAVAHDITTVLFRTLASVRPELVDQALNQAKIAAVTKQESGVRPNYILNSSVYTHPLRESEIEHGNVSGAVYIGGMVVSVAGLAPATNREVADAILMRSFDHVQDRLAMPLPPDSVRAHAA